MFIKMKWLFYCLGIVLFNSLTSCEPKRPTGVVDNDKMAEVLYDYHLAQSMARANFDSTHYNMNLYTTSALKKHGMDTEDFDRSMEWYARHSHQLLEVYKLIDKRLSDETSSSVWREESITYSTTGDTANVWNGRDCYLLSSKGVNQFSFYLPADTLMGPNDKLEWQFNTQWLYYDGQKSATAMLAVRFDNDSVQFTNSQVIGTGLQKLSLRVGKRTIKSVEGFVYLQSEWTSRPRLLVVSHPILLRYKNPKSSDDLKNKLDFLDSRPQRVSR